MGEMEVAGIRWKLHRYAVNVNAENAKYSRFNFHNSLLPHPDDDFFERGLLREASQLLRLSRAAGFRTEFTLGNAGGGGGLEKIKCLTDINDDPQHQLLAMKEFYEEKIQQLEDGHRQEVQKLENKNSRLLAALQDKNKYLRQAKKDAKARKATPSHPETLQAADNEELVLGLKTEMERLAQENSELRRQREQEHDRYEETILCLKSEMQILADDNHRAKREMEDRQSVLVDELSRIQEGNVEKDKKIDLLEKKLHLLQDDNGRHLEKKQREETQALENKCSRLLKAIQDKNTYLRKAKKDIQKLKRDIDEKQVVLMEELNRLQIENREKEMKLDILLNLLQNGDDEKEIKIDLLEKEMNRLQSGNNEKEMKIDLLEKERNRLQSGNDEKEMKIDLLEKELSRLQNGNDEKEMKIALLEKEKMEESRKVVLLEATVANLEHHLETLVRSMQTQERECVAMEEEIVGLKEDVARMEEEKRQLESSLASSRLELDKLLTQWKGPAANPNEEEEEEDREPARTAKENQEGANIEKGTPLYKRLLGEIRNLKGGQKLLRKQLLEGQEKYEELESIVLSLQNKGVKRRDWFQKEIDSFSSCESKSRRLDKLPRPDSISCECGPTCEAQNIEIEHTIMAREGDTFFMVKKRREGPDLRKRQEKEMRDKILKEKLMVRLREEMKKRFREMEESLEEEIQKIIKEEIEKVDREVIEKMIKEKIQEMFPEPLKEDIEEVPDKNIDETLQETHVVPGKEIDEMPKHDVEVPGKEMEIMTEEETKKKKKKKILRKIWKILKMQWKRLKMCRNVRKRQREERAERRAEIKRKLALEKFLKKYRPSRTERKGKKQVQTTQLQALKNGWWATFQRKVAIIFSWFP
ncbi:uncharacterized protein LOC135226019 [Macrobrachium nipponense]|uniref:uncharacterized protein LOC135226019 n=1 Tax=Macrobrachium nipponense TaxID=159736 RepID=UPI0030C89438